MITSLALVPLLVVVWFALALPLAVLLGRCISAGQSTHSGSITAARGRLAEAAVDAGGQRLHGADQGTSRTAAA